MDKEDYYDYKQSRTLSSFKHALIVIGIAFISFVSFEIGTMVSQNSELNYYSDLLNPAIPNIEVGQTWRYSIYKNDPFKQEVKIDKKVIGVKDNYVLFVQSYSDTIYNNSVIYSDTISEDKNYFVIGSELLVPSIRNRFKLKYITVDENIQKYKFKYDFLN